MEVKMPGDKRYLVDVMMKGLPFPIKAVSRAKSEGQETVANISIAARINREFEAGWIDHFIKVLHQHRERIGTKYLKKNLDDYLNALNAAYVKIDYQYPFFIEKTTPVSKEKCLVRYLCTYSAKFSSALQEPKIIFCIEVPCISTYPQSEAGKPGGLFGQLSIVAIEMESNRDIFPEDIVAMVDKHALAPVYSYMSGEDQGYIINKAHSEIKTSVAMTDEIKDELAGNPDIDWFAIRCSNYGMLHSYSTVVSTEKGIWTPVGEIDTAADE